MESYCSSLFSVSGGFGGKDQNLSPYLERQLWSRGWLGEDTGCVTLGKFSTSLSLSFLVVKYAPPPRGYHEV